MESDYRRTYKAWKNMLYRCTNPAHRQWADYGGRGITVCERWYVFLHFLEDMGYPPPKYTLERIDNEGNYCLANCKWATRTEQNSNRREFRWWVQGVFTKS